MERKAYFTFRLKFSLSSKKKIQDFSNKIRDHYNVYNDYLLVKEKVKTLQSKKYNNQFDKNVQNLQKKSLKLEQFCNKIKKNI